jgi:hypothetical protein
MKICKHSAQGTCSATSPRYFLREIITNSVSILNGKPFLLEALVDTRKSERDYLFNAYSWLANGFIQN